jgi:hypothetical protein
MFPSAAPDKWAAPESRAQAFEKSRKNLIPPLRGDSGEPHKFVLQLVFLP